MGAINTISTIDEILKEYYVAKYDRVNDLVYKKAPLLALLSKDEKLTGRKFPIPVKYSLGGGRSANFSYAQNKEKAIGFEAFELEAVDNYSIATITGRAIDASENNAGAFASAVTEAVDSAFSRISRDLARNLFRKSTGSIGQISSGSDVDTDTITLADKEDAFCFEVGMSIGAAATDGGTARTGSTTGEVLEAIDRAAGELTATSVHWSTVLTNIAASDYLYVAGDLNAKMHGLADWIPTTAPGSSDNFMGVNRSVDTDRLAGVRYDGSSDAIEDALTNGVSEIWANGGDVSHIFMNHKDWRRVANSLQGQSEYLPMQNTNAKIGFKALSIPTDSGEAKILSDPNCSRGVAYALELDSWKLMSMGKAPKILDNDGQRVLRLASDDGYEARIGSRADLACFRIGHNGVITLPSA